MFEANFSQFLYTKQWRFNLVSSAIVSSVVVSSAAIWQNLILSMLRFVRYSFGPLTYLSVDHFVFTPFCPMVVSYYSRFVRYTLCPYDISFECVLSVYAFVRYPFCPYCCLSDGRLVLTAIRPNVFGPILISHNFESLSVPVL